MVTQLQRTHSITILLRLCHIHLASTLCSHTVRVCLLTTSQRRGKDDITIHWHLQAATLIFHLFHHLMTRHIIQTQTRFHLSPRCTPLADPRIRKPTGNHKLRVISRRGSLSHESSTSVGWMSCTLSMHSATTPRMPNGIFVVEVRLFVLTDYRRSREH